MLEQRNTFTCIKSPIKYPDYYGIDTPNKKDLIAANLSVDEIAKQIGVKSLKFLSIEGLYKALGYKIEIIKILNLLIIVSLVITL